LRLSHNPSLIGTNLNESSGSLIIHEAFEPFEALYYN
jgi:hypothetical protein